MLLWWYQFLFNGNFGSQNIPKVEVHVLQLGIKCCQICKREKQSPSYNVTVKPFRKRISWNFGCTVQNKKFEMVSHFSNSSWIWLAMCTKWLHHAEILIGHFREMIGNWPVSSYQSPQSSLQCTSFSPLGWPHCVFSAHICADACWTWSWSRPSHPVAAFQQAFSSPVQWLKKNNH